MRDYNISLASTTLFLARVVTITRLDGAVLRIAEADEPIMASAQTFLPLPGAEISAVKHIIDGEMGSMEIRFAHSAGGTLDTGEVNDGFWDGASVQMYLVDRSAATTFGDPIFTGIIDAVTIDPIGASGSFDIRGLTASGEAFIQTFQPMCRTDLFSSLCQLNENDWDHTGTVGTIVDRFSFTVAGLGAPPADGWFNQGTFVTASGFKAVIANWSLGTLLLKTYMPVCVSRVTAGEGLTIYPGCDKTLLGPNGCKIKFGNNLNMQAEPHFLGVNSIVGV